MRLAGSSSERLRLPRRKDSRRFLRRRGHNREGDADPGSCAVVLLPDYLAMMLAQDALTRAQAQAGERLGRNWIGVAARDSSMLYCAGTLVANTDDYSAVLVFRDNSQRAAAVL